MKLKTLRQIIEGMSDDAELRLYNDKDKYTPWIPVITCGFTKIKDKDTGEEVCVLVLRTI